MTTLVSFCQECGRRFVHQPDEHDRHCSKCLARYIRRLEELVQDLHNEAYNCTNWHPVAHSMGRSA